MVIIGADKNGLVYNIFPEFGLPFNDRYIIDDHKDAYNDPNL